MVSQTTLISLFDDVLDESPSKNEVEFHDVLKALETRGFGALLILPSLIIVLPTGAIPGVPAICALFIILIAGQVAFGKKKPWIPQKLKKQAVPKDKFKQSVDKAKPYLKTLNKFIGKRLTFMTNSIMQRLSALIIIILSIMIIIVGFIPFSAFFPAFSILLFGLGFTFRDGVITTIALSTTLACLIGIPYFFLV